jgi:hypothetical protein
MLLKVTFLQGVNEIVVEELVKRLSTLLFLEGDLVIRRGELGEWMGLIGKGTVAILSPSDGSVIREMAAGEYVGEMCLLFSSARTVDVKAATWVVLHTWSKNDLDVVKVNYPDEIEYIEEFLEDLMIQKQYKHVSVPTGPVSQKPLEIKGDDEESVLSNDEGGGGGSKTDANKLSDDNKIDEESNKNKHRPRKNSSLKVNKSKAEGGRSIQDLEQKIEQRKRSKSQGIIPVVVEGVEGESSRSSVGKDDSSGRR